MLPIKSHYILGLLVLVPLATPSLTASINLPSEVRAEEYSLGRKALAIEGYDPVAYFSGTPAKGKKAHTYTHKGVQYRFASADNLETFKAEPARYEPQYGNWCAWAMYDGGGRTKVDPETFKIVDGKLYLFYNGLFGDTLEFWNERIKNQTEASMIRTADRYWNEQVAP